MPDSPPIRSRDALFEPFHQSEKPARDWTIGTEAEKFGVRQDGTAVRYDEEGGIVDVLRLLVENHGWKPRPETVGGPLIALSRGRASITLEPGGQVELSGAPLGTIHETETEFAGHRAELQRIGENLGIEWLALGYHPFARQDDFDWVPKLRYAVMRDYLLTRGSRARDMMRRTCTVQANLDYSDEADALRKLRLALAATPIVTAMFAASPWSEGKRGVLSERAKVWTGVDPDRTGMLPFMWGRDASYARYIEWGLDAPMFLFKRDGKPVHNTGQTFRSFLDEGFKGHVATMEDWDAHLNTLFPEVRLKRTLELRSTDSQPMSRLTALPALWKGLLYSPEAQDELEAIFERVSAAEASAAQKAVAAAGMDTEYSDKSLREWSEVLLDIAKDGLVRLGNLDGEGRDESRHLEPLYAMAGKTPAQLMLQAAPGDTPERAAVIAATRF